MPALSLALILTVPQVSFKTYAQPQSINPPKAQFIIDDIGYIINPDSLTVSVANDWGNVSYSQFPNGGIYDGLEKIVIPPTIDYNGKEYTVNNIAKSAFCNCINLKEVILPNTIKVIGEYAFFETGIKNLILPEGLEVIEGFGLDSDFDELVIPSTLTMIRSQAIRYVKKLTWNARYCETDPKYTKQFICAQKLEEIYFGDEVEIIPFGICESSLITNVTIPESVTVIEENAFAGTHKLESVVIPNGVTTIKAGAFSDSGISSMVLPESLTCIGDNAFLSTKITSLKLPESLSYIGLQAFMGCDQLTTVEWNNSLRHIGGSAFKDCVNMTSPIVFPEGFQCVQTAAFTNCANVPLLKSYILNPQDISTDSIKKVWAGNRNCVLSIPYGTRAKYDSCSNVWIPTRFLSIVERLTSNGITGNVNGDDAVDGSDLNVMINYLLGDEGLCDDDNAGDINGDGNLDGADINALINTLLGKD